MFDIDFFEFNLFGFDQLFQSVGLPNLSFLAITYLRSVWREEEKSPPLLTLAQGREEMVNSVHLTVPPPQGRSKGATFAWVSASQGWLTELHPQFLDSWRRGV